MTTPGRRACAACSVLIALLALPPSPARAAEDRPPEQGATLRFKKTLGIQSTPGGRVFFETRRMVQEDRLSRILTEEYAIEPEAVPALVEAFRAVNPGADPEHLKAAQEARIPFKLEVSASSLPATQESEPSAYTIRQGDSLWRVLRGRFKVAHSDMEAALRAVAKANPRVKNWNHLVPGQTVVVPQPFALGSPPAGPNLSAEARGVLTLLAELGCRVAEKGRMLLPIGRGRTLRVDNQEFPTVTGPSGQSVILDPGSRMTAALTRGLEDSWGYAVLQGTEGGAEALLERILPRMGFPELSNGTRTASLGGGVELVAKPRWSVVSRPDDLVDGPIHLIFSAGSDLSPGVVSTALKSGFSLHVLGGRRLKAAGTGAEEPPQLAMRDAPAGAGILLGLLGVPHEVRPEVACEVSPGVQYKVRPELTFSHGGISYAIAPSEPERAADLLERAGYVSVSWNRKAPLIDRIGDLLALVGVAHRRAVVELPKAEAPLKLRISALLVDEPRFVKALYPRYASASGQGRTLVLTDGELDAQAAAALRAEGFLPWLLRER